jgi:integrase
LNVGQHLRRDAILPHRRAERVGDRKGNKKNRAADLADGTWPNLTGKFKPHDDRHTHATWLDDANLNKVIQMDRRGHAMPGMDAVYTHVTLEMRRRLCDVLEQLWNNAVTQRRRLSPTSAVPLLNEILSARDTVRPA